LENPNVRPALQSSTSVTDISNSCAGLHSLIPEKGVLMKKEESAETKFNAHSF